MHTTITLLAAAIALLTHLQAFAVQPRYSILQGSTSGEITHFTVVAHKDEALNFRAINILKEQISDEDWNTTIPDGIAEIFSLGVKLGGTLSGEHGIGIAKRPYMAIAMKETNLNIMRGIKKVFDPNGILNPGKIF